MGNKDHVACLILAGGKSSRAETVKALRIYKDQIWINYIIQHYLNFAVSNVAVGLGYHADLITEKIVPNKNVRLIKNPNQELGQFSTLFHSINQIIDDDWNRLIITLVDSIPMDNTNLQSMLERKNDIVRPSYRGKTGHPIVISKKICVQILNEEMKLSRLDYFLNKHRMSTDFLEINDDSILTNLNTATEWQDFLKRND